MKIAQVTPLYESVPPQAYGGTERVVAFLTDELVRMGHNVTLFATGDSETMAKLVPCRETGLRLDKSGLTSDLADHLAMMTTIREMADHFDVIHFHTDMIHMPYFEHCADKTVTTQHGRLDLKGLANFYANHSDYPLVSISNHQRKPLPKANWAKTIYHGLPLDLHRFTPDKGQTDLVFLGRFSPEKGAEKAINIARRTNSPIRLAAKICTQINANQVYYTDVIEPLLNKPGVEYIGEINERQKTEFVGNSKALLMPINWPEPFGIVMIEAMACGTPVIAYNHGSVPEVIEHGVTGFIVNNEDEAVEAVGRLGELDRNRIRQRFEERFSSRVMAQQYLDLYQELIDPSRVVLAKDVHKTGLLSPAVIEAGGKAPQEEIAALPGLLTRAQFGTGRTTKN